ncbi:ATP-grasp domain-containing protein [Calderihabitans maritimus]|uniref:Alpha-L-glutamate ligase n=1 Tax=Calderihabitans maritimus TaxID=1246530 RepID=A0A1Z5HQ02_9FIRM|nr:hypothetical protein [Calderihabitans maritimus]GAW91375.1 alpha-L-glutamate ligase [Calderihabitans maritimus]
MRLVTFDPFRTLGIPGVLYIKPEMIFSRRREIEEADWVLFPEYWQVNALVYGLKKRIFPSVSSYHLGHDKVEMTRALWAVFPEYVPHTLILPGGAESVEKILDEMTLPLVVKEVRSSQGRGVRLVETERELLAYAETNKILYVQERLPIDRDLRVVFVGEEVLTAYWRIGGEGNFYNNVARGARVSFEDIPEEVLRVVTTIARHFEINHAGFDVAFVDGRPYILEFNVLFGNQALRERKVPLEEKILEYLRKYTPTFPVTPNFPIKKVS